MTVTLPRASHMALALLLIAAVFVGAYAIGHSGRQRAAAAQTAAPVRFAPNSSSVPRPTVTVPRRPPPLPALKARGPGVSSARTIRSRRR